MAEMGRERRKMRILMAEERERRRQRGGGGRFVREGSLSRQEVTDGGN